MGTPRHLMAMLLLAALCALVFAAWRNPHLMLDLSNLVRACF